MKKFTDKVMASTQTYPTVLHADQEHAGLRTAVFALLFISLVLAFFGLRALFSSFGTTWMAEYAFALSCGGAFPLAVGVIWAAEQYMKRHWPSGRTVTLLGNGIQVQTETGETVALTQDQGVVPLGWYFSLRGWQRGGRERRVPQDWLCLALELKASKDQIIVYTYLPEDKVQLWLNTKTNVSFHKIYPTDVYDNSMRARLKGPGRPEIPAEVITGKDGKYWLAERRRWTEGFELPAPEFEIFIDHIQMILKL